jgi:acyl-CoA thioester hydrolase
MAIYTKLITVTKAHLDELNHVNNVQYVQWIQDIAKEHWFKKSSSEMNNNYYWVVLSHHIDYKSSAILNDEITLKTYITNSEGVTSTRIVEMYNSKTNKLIVKAETKWCLINAVTHKPSRISSEIATLFN